MNPTNEKSWSRGLMRCLLACLIGVSALWPGAWVRAQKTAITHQNAFHVAPTSRMFSSQELLFLQHIKGWFRRHHLRAPRYDVGLREAAWHLARRMAQGKGRQLSHSTVRAALWIGGSSDQRIRVFGHGYQEPKALWKALDRSLSRSLAGQRPNFHGFAIAGGKTKVCILLLSRRGAMLSPLPRWYYVGQTLEIRGRLLSSFQSPSVVLGMAGGRVVRPVTKKLPGRRFVARWHIDQPGEVRVQVLVNDDEGPWLTTQYTALVVSVAHNSANVQRRLWQAHRSKLTATPMKMMWLSRQKANTWTPKTASLALLKRVNQLRKQHKLPLLRQHRRLSRLAKRHAEDMVRHHFFAHTSPQKGSFAERFQRLGWKVKLARENIVAATTPEKAYALLFQSPVHRANLFLRKAIYTGIGAAKDAKGVFFFTQVFVAP